MPTTLNSIMAEGNTSATAAATAAGETAEQRRAAARMARAGEATYGLNLNLVELSTEDPPTGPEVTGWYVYGACSYFVQAFLLPVLFPLMVAQRASPIPFPPANTCHRGETNLYQMLVHHTISTGHSKLSPLHWTAISWFVGIIVTAPLLPKLANHLDHGYHQPFILGAGTALGSFICLLTGFFNTAWLFPFYIAIIIVCITSASAVHTRHLGLIIRGLASSSRTQPRIIISSRMSLSATAFGSFATAIIALFTFHMLRRSDHLTSLWVVSIFCGLKWFLGFFETFFSNRPGSPSSSLTLIANYWPQLIGRLLSVFLSSFSSTCIFTSATLYIAGSLCMKPVLVLALWLVYFFFTAFTLPALHAMQLLMRSDPVKMNLFGFILSATASGLGFYYKNEKWHWVAIMLVAFIQSAGAGILHAFSKVMILDRAPQGREGVFASWYEWVKISGACAGFALTAICPDDIRKTFGISFLAVFIGIVVLIFGSEVRDFGGGLRRRKSDGGSSENGMEKGGDQSKEYIGERKGKQGEGSVQV